MTIAYILLKQLRVLLPSYNFLVKRYTGIYNLYSKYHEKELLII